MDATDPAYILATSGTTARPKLAVHTHGGNMVQIAAMGRWMMGLTAGEIWWSMSDIGWIVGHSYIVYAPLMAGCTTVAYEGSLDHPAPDATWALIAELRVRGIFTVPTGVRLLMRYGTDAARAHDLSSVERVVCAGEVLNAPGLALAPGGRLRGPRPGHRSHVADRDRRPDLRQPVRPGAAAHQARVRRAAAARHGAGGRGPDGTPLPAGEKGIMVLRRPFPGLIATLWGEPERYGTDYWSRVPGSYYVGDAAHIDADGYVWFAGRADEIIKIAAHRLGTIEVETRSCVTRPSPRPA